MRYYDELLRTPNILSRVMEEKPQPISTARRIVFCGCGTSFYLGGQAANICGNYAINSAAADAIDIVDGRFEFQSGDVFAFISRSGNSMETALAMEKVKAAGAHTYYIGCTGDSKLSSGCAHSAVIEYAGEVNILESYSFYAQLVLACICAGVPVEHDVPKAVEEALKRADVAYAEYVKGRSLTRCISLSAPFYRPVTRELMLKDGEITQLPAEAWGTLEFRHGPRSWAGESTLIHFTPGKLTEAWDRNVSLELISYGCPVIYYGNDSPEGAYGAAFSPERYSLGDVLCACAFHTALACHIGESLATTPENLRNIIHNVGVL